LLGVQGGVPAGAGLFHRVVRLAQDADHVGAQDCRLPGPSFVTALHLLMTRWQHCCTPASRGSSRW
jgi:hypothetical protein